MFCDKLLIKHKFKIKTRKLYLLQHVPLRPSRININIFFILYIILEFSEQRNLRHDIVDRSYFVCFDYHCKYNNYFFSYQKRNGL